MRQRNPDFVDRYLELERRVRRQRRGTSGGARVGPWYDLEPHLAVLTNPELQPQLEGFAVRRWDGPDGAAWGEFRGAIFYITDDPSDGGILDIAMPSEYRPVGLRDVWCGIDGDNTPTDFYPVGGGFSYDITTAGFIIVDPARVVVNLSATPPVLQHAGAGNRNGYPGDTTVTIWNGVLYPITAL